MNQVKIHISFEQKSQIFYGKNVIILQVQY